MKIHDLTHRVMHPELHQACLKSFQIYFESTQVRDWETAASVLHDRFTFDLRGAGVNKVYRFTREQFIEFLKESFKDRYWVPDYIEVNEFRVMLGVITQRLTMTYHHAHEDTHEVIERFRGTYHSQYVQMNDQVFMSGMIVELDESEGFGNHFKN